MKWTRHAPRKRYPSALPPWFTDAVDAGTAPETIQAELKQWLSREGRRVPDDRFVTDLYRLYCDILEECTDNPV